MSGPSNPKDFISIADWSRDAIEAMLARASELKAQRKRREPGHALQNRSVLLYFEKPSLRTLVSFEIGVAELGGHPVYLPPSQVRIGEREAIEDVSRNLSCWCDAIVARTHSHQLVLDLAREASVPVINALTDYLHPCQAMADVMTVAEHGDRSRDRLVYVGDGNNVAHSLIHIAGRLGMRLTVCTPEGYRPAPEVVSRGLELAREEGGDLRLESDPHSAMKDAAFVYTDAWTSMGQEAETRERQAVFQPYRVNASLLSSAPSDVRILHCGPVHRGEEITSEVLDSERSLVVHQAENRLHAQKAVLEALVLEP
ncbi:MAG: ornithine carbamoyltransferase [Deltaproteobacteria bacterium]|nr:MAG: ornithine carbamoyltransferase [Deltaproteobacteria bacterium]TDJ09060.1 MAG: ornithine carbamoyltransferase [Deltaproteobacteria bacterium]